VNKVILIGRLARDPELRATAGGANVCSFAVACDRQFVRQGEERQADFINCVAWRQQAEFLAKYFAKGHRIALEGTLQVRNYDDKEGQKRYVSEVIVDHIEFVQSKSESSGASGQSRNYDNQIPPGYNPAPSQLPKSASEGDVDGFMPIEEDDLPF
jgi:single-strand DNA-binding protein